MYSFVNQFAESGTAQESGGFAALGLDLGAFAVQLITFLIVFYILKRYVFGRVVDVLDKRQKTIEEGVKSAEAITKQKEKLEEEVSKIRSEARKKADEILAESKAQSEDLLAKASASAEEKSDKMIQEAKKKIEEESERSRRSLKSEIVGLVVDTTEKLIGVKVDNKKDTEIIEDALSTKGTKS